MHLHPKPIITPECTHYGIFRYFQIRLQLSHIIIEKKTNETQYWINILCSDMVARTLKSVASESKNGLGKSWPSFWIPFHGRFDRVTSIYFHTNSPQSKYPIKEPEFLSRNSGRSLIDRASFIKWEDYGTPRSKMRKVNIRILINGISYYINEFRRHFQDHIKLFHTNAKFCKSKLQTFPETSKVSLIM